MSPAILTVNVSSNTYFVFIAVLTVCGATGTAVNVSSLSEVEATTSSELSPRISSTGSSSSNISSTDRRFVSASEAVGSSSSSSDVVDVGKACELRNFSRFFGTIEERVLSLFFVGLMSPSSSGLSIIICGTDEGRGVSRDSMAWETGISWKDKRAIASSRLTGGTGLCP